MRLGKLLPGLSGQFASVIPVETGAQDQLNSIRGSLNQQALWRLPQSSFEGKAFLLLFFLLIPGKRYQCSGDGCRLACRSMKELLDHMQVHYRPTESLEGKAALSNLSVGIGWVVQEKRKSRGSHGNFCFLLSSFLNFAGLEPKELPFHSFSLFVCN